MKKALEVIAEKLEKRGATEEVENGPSEDFVARGKEFLNSFFEHMGLEALELTCVEMREGGWMVRTVNPIPLNTNEFGDEPLFLAGTNFVDPDTDASFWHVDIFTVDARGNEQSTQVCYLKVGDTWARWEVKDLWERLLDAIHETQTYLLIINKRLQKESDEQQYKAWLATQPLYTQITVTELNEQTRPFEIIGVPFSNGGYQAQVVIRYTDLD